jgi:hypothetical protein
LDGSNEFVLFNSTTRQTAVWYFNGSTYNFGVFGPTLATGYTLAAP